MMIRCKILEELMMEETIILVDKPVGMTSFKVVAKVRGALKSKYGHKVKVGHTGTLDPFATGLLILLTGKMTKKFEDFLKLDKIYEATVRLGAKSSTGDPEGEIQPCSEDKPSVEKIQRVLGTFVGEIEQKPPRYSAIKINGERAYKLARKGVDFEVPSRKVRIYDLEILDYQYPLLKLRCSVSSGTYIRTLAEDIGEALGTGAYCLELRRIQIGDFKVEGAKSLEELTK